MERSAPFRNLAPTSVLRNASIIAVTAPDEISDSSNTHSNSSSSVSSPSPALITRPPCSTTPPPSSTLTLLPISVSIVADLEEPFGADSTLTNFLPVVVRIIAKSTREPFGRACSTPPRFLVSFWRAFSAFCAAFFWRSSNFFCTLVNSTGKAISSSSSKSSQSSSSSTTSLSNSSSRSSQSSSSEFVTSSSATTVGSGCTSCADCRACWASSDSSSTDSASVSVTSATFLNLSNNPM